MLHVVLDQPPFRMVIVLDDNKSFHKWRFVNLHSKTVVGLLILGLSRAATQPASLGTWSLPKAPGKGKMPMEAIYKDNIKVKLVASWQ